MAQTAAATTEYGDLTETLAAWSSGLGHNQIPAAARRVATQALLDVIGVSLPGAAEPLSRMLQAEMEEAGGKPVAHVIGTGMKTSAVNAALLNGAAAHALDYDDVLAIFTGHPSVPVLPALLALAEETGASGRDVVTAFVAGVEVEARIGGLMGGGHYARGFHATGTIGTFGAAAAAARLMGLDAEATARALGLAGTQAAGLKSNFGTMAKPLHAGKAAMNGLLAARLAARGFTARTDILDRPQGFAATQADGTDDAAARERLGEHFHTPDLLFKYHAACYGTHAAIEAAAKAAGEPGFEPDRIARVEIMVHDACIGMCDIAEPSTGLEAKFSLAHNIGLGLTGQASGGLDLYEDDRVADPKVVPLRPRVSISSSADLGKFFAALRVEMTDGRVIETTHDAAVPDDDLDRQQARLEAKFRALAVPHVGEAGADAIIAATTAFDREDADVGALMTLVRA